MFRNFYAKQSMEDPRDSWYKPNLLYNIHYKPPTPTTLPTPPKPPTPPRLIVVTKESNPSVCTCGKHCCKPHYRMEREVVWSSSELRNVVGVMPKERIHLEKDVKIKVREYGINGEDRDNNKKVAIAESEEKQENTFSSNGRLCNLKGMANELNEMGKYEADFVDFAGQGDDMNTMVGGAVLQKVRERKSSPTSDIKKLKEESREEYIVGGNDEMQMQDKLQNDRPHTAYDSHITADADIDEYGSAFGIMRVFCESGLHTAWSAKNESHGY